MSELTEEQRKEEADKLYNKLKQITLLNQPVDMNVDKTLQRIGVIGVMGGVTRTTTLGAALFAGMHGPLVGLSKVEILAIVEQAYDAAAAVPNMADMAEKYALSNAAAKEQQKQQESLGELPLLPLSDKVH